MQWINIHTHQPPEAQVWAIQSRFEQFDNIPSMGCFSAGIHPWYIGANWQQQFMALQQCCNASNVLAIGECGLDRVCSTGFSFQLQVFEAQVQLAGQLQKPLVIHCVKAFDKVIEVLQRNRVQVPVIFHGFNRNAVLAAQLAAKGYFLSFGKALERPAVQQALKAVPAGHFFLETDDATISIASVYNLAATVLEIDINTLSLQLKKNTLAVFGNSISDL